MAIATLAFALLLLAISASGLVFFERGAGLARLDECTTHKPKTLRRG